MKDLFDDYQNLPENVKIEIDIFNHCNDAGVFDTFDLCNQLVVGLEKNGYTCNYSLSGEPYYLHIL